ncbi:MAG: MBL fold metallo-hydrolase, partial [Pseudomonadota bacterium]|nr:MBL fold metallo-hydrolase [Pseudomonadota bacterium]
ARCRVIADACRGVPRTAVELIPVVFQRALDEHQTGFAFGEVLAHVNYMLARGELTQDADGVGIARFRTR